MRLAFISALASVPLLAIAPAFASPRIHRGPTSPHLLKSHAAAAPRVAAPRPAPVRAIASERATQIQAALIKSGYLTGAPSGVWDTQTQAAMQKLQADNGWQTKLIPDSRAIIKLGLGSSPSPAADLASANPESAAPSLSSPSSNQ